MAERDAYKQRLKDHLKETKSHARQLERRIKKLGGKAEAGPLPEVGPDVAQAAPTATHKAAALAQGQISPARAGAAEKQLKNAKTETPTSRGDRQFHRERDLAEAVGASATAQLARDIRRDGSAWPSSWPARSP